MGVSDGETNGGPVPDSGVREPDGRVPNGDGGEVEDAPPKKGSGSGIPTIEIETRGGGGDGGAVGSRETLDGLLRQFVSGVMRPGGDQPIAWRIRASYGEAAPRIPEASRNSAAEVLAWVRAGSHFRALLVTAIGTVTLLALTGLMVFMVFFLVATVNAIIISLLVSLAAAGGMLAIFFACLAFVYIGALSVAAFVISSITISTIIAVFIATGWVGFFWILWMAARKSVDLTKQSLSITGSAITAYSASRNVHHHED